MKKILYTLLLISGGAIALQSCNNGDYTANPDTNANTSINPLNPLSADDFTWGGSDPFSANINGSPWQAEVAQFAYDTLGNSYVIATKGTSMFRMTLNSVWAGNLYDLPWKTVTDRYVVYTDSAGTGGPGSYYYSNLGNSGRVFINRNDSAQFLGRFYFQGVNAYGKVINITDGYFKIDK